MDTEYDFTQTINNIQLLDEINTAGLPAPDYINSNGTAVAIFYATALTSSQSSTLATVVANHVANPNYIPLATQAQVTTLINYLNNSNTSVSNTARACIVQALAPHLSVTLLTAINTQINSITGV